MRSQAAIQSLIEWAIRVVCWHSPSAAGKSRPDSRVQQRAIAVTRAINVSVNTGVAAAKQPFHRTCRRTFEAPVAAFP